jgi:CBS domain containing-hemolysin-like protein
MEFVIPILIITGLIIANGLFVAAEFAIVGVPRATIEHLASQGHRVARHVQQIITDPRSQDRYIATAQIGITTASLGLGMYGEHMVAAWIAQGLESLGAGQWIAAHALASVLAIAILTYFHIVIGEMVPKSLALLFAERTALYVTPPMRWIQYALHPFVVSLNGIGNGVLKLMHIKRDFAASHQHTSDEIEYLVRESREGGLLASETCRVLCDLLGFGELTASEVMVPRVHVSALSLESTPEQVLTCIRESHHTRYPVYDGDLDHIIGMIHIKDLFGLLRSGATLRDSNIRTVPYLPETAELDAVLVSMRQAHAQLVVIMDEQGGTAGIITLEDLFDEVVGDIGAGETTTPDIVWDDEGNLRVTGTARIDEVGDAFNVSLEHEDVDTVSGLVLTVLKRPAVVGDVVMYQQLHFQVLEVDGHGVGSCLVTRETPR